MLFTTHRAAVVSAITFFVAATSYAADIKMSVVTSPGFELYTTDAPDKGKDALKFIEAARANILAAFHTENPDGKPVRIVAFRNLSELEQYRPANMNSAHYYVQPGKDGKPVIVLMNIKPDTFEFGVRQFAQVILDSAAPGAPYWFRMGVAQLYSTLQPAGGGKMKFGGGPHRSYKSGAAFDLVTLFTIDARAARESDEALSTIFNSEGQHAAFDTSQGALAGVGAGLSMDYTNYAWMLTHMLVFHDEYRAKWGAFVGAMAAGNETGAAFTAVYGKSVNQVAADLKLYAARPGLVTITQPAKLDKPVSPEARAATSQEADAAIAWVTTK